MIIWVVKIFFVHFFCVFLPPLLNVSASVRLLQFLSFIMPILVWNVPLISPIFLKISLVFPSLWFSSISLHYSFKKAFYLSLLFSGSLHSVWYVFSFLPCLLLLFFPQIFIKPPWTTTLLLAFLFLGCGFGHCLLYSVMSLHLWFFRHSVHQV